MASSSVLPFVRGVDFSGIDMRTNSLSERALEMSNLRWLRLNNVSLEQLPEDIDSYHKLEVLSVTHNKIRGLYDVDPVTFPSLKVLNARDNSLKDSGVPPGMFQLQDLVTLDLSHNELKKVPDELKEAKDLNVLSLSHNHITSIPGQLFVKCAGLKFLDLSYNDIQSLPPQLRRLGDLTTLNISNNPKMEHFVFKVFDKLTYLTELNLSNCGRTIENTPHLDKLENLTDINLSHNNLPRIPESVYLLEKLRRINFSYNQIRELSSLVDTWRAMVTLDMSHNLLTALHPNICKCTKLKRIFVSDNKITFEGIPTGIGKLTELEHFIASRNNLECIPEGLCRCYSLKKLILNSNNLLTLPEAVHFMKIAKFDISNNPRLEMPPKPKAEVQGAGAEFYNIDFEAEQLQEGAVVASIKGVKTSYSKQKERFMKLRRRASVTQRGGGGSDESAAMKVLKGMVDIAEYKQSKSSTSSDVMSAGAGIEVVEETENPLKQPKRWDEVLVRPDLDYSVLFVDDTGTLPGITMWQVENFYPVLVDEALRHHFYTGDAYIVLNTFFNNDLELDWDIYYWIGAEAALDKKACAAMHSVNLRNMLSCRRRTKREEQGDESDEFKELFDYNLSYIEGGTASGFYCVEEEEYQTRLYALCGEHNGMSLYLRSVALIPESLDHTHVFILDVGKEIFIWCGGKSKLNERSKARLISERINKLQRKGIAQITMFRAGIETDEFWEWFGGYPRVSIKATPSEDCSAGHRLPKVYKPGLGQGYLELPQVTCRNTLSRKMLKPTEVYLFDCHSDIFVWIGRNSARLVRAAAMRLADELVQLMSRPVHTLVTRVLEGIEPMAFRLRFSDWHDIIRVDYTVSPQALQNKRKEKSPSPFSTPERKAPKVDLSALFHPRKEVLTGSESEELMAYYNSLLKTMQCCVIEGRKFSILPKEEKGHFYSGECYFFLCQYTIEDEDSNSDESEPDEEEVQTVVYFWQGIHASKMGWLQFTLGIQKQLENAMGSIDVICFKQQQETLQFLSHFGGKVVIHQGRRSEAATNFKPTLYQIRANNGRITRRIAQVPTEPKYLNSCFNHILKVPFENSPGSGIVYVWIGSETRTEEAISAEQMGRAMFEGKFSIVVVKEGAEPENFFWVALGGRKEYETDAEYMNWRRLFRCSNEKGYFTVSEKTPDFCQSDMSDEDVMFLDTGKEVFIWFGSSCSEIEKKLAIKSVQVYIKNQATGETPDTKRKLKIAKRGQEPWEFTRCFHGWSQLNN